MSMGRSGATGLSLCRQGIGAGRAAQGIGLERRYVYLRFPLVRQPCRFERSYLPVHQRGQCPKPPVQLSLHLEEKEDINIEQAFRGGGSNQLPSPRGTTIGFGYSLAVASCFQAGSP